MITIIIPIIINSNSNNNNNTNIHTTTTTTNNNFNNNTNTNNNTRRFDEIHIGGSRSRRPADWPAACRMVISYYGCKY